MTRRPLPRRARAAAQARLPAGSRGFGRGQMAPPVAAGRYRATLGTLVGDKVTPIGDPQAFQVFVIPQ